ncbi:hypothetical protein OSTOST_04936 [Ostertagia ostertagi]
MTPFVWWKVAVTVTPTSKEEKLFELKPASKKADSCQECYDSVKTLVNQMVSAGYDIRNTCDPMWSETILKKFPYEIVKNILVKHQETDTMEIDSLLEALDREITAKAYVESRLGETHPARESNLGMQRPVETVNIVTDSEVALCWIKSSRKLPVFVSNQCVRIHKLRSQIESENVTVQFFHVPTSYNPADAGTRGLSKEQIINSAWVKGPRWLEALPKSAFYGLSTLFKQRSQPNLTQHR